MLWIIIGTLFLTSLVVIIDRIATKRMDDLARQVNDLRTSLIETNNIMLEIIRNANRKTVSSAFAANKKEAYTKPESSSYNETDK